MVKMQPALRDYLTKLREEAYIDIKPGYLDTGASPNETQPIYTTATTENSNPGNSKKKKKLGIF
jgi:peptidyl-prolyl cis-trans isomerase SurA